MFKLKPATIAMLFFTGTVCAEEPGNQSSGQLDDDQHSTPTESTSRSNETSTNTGDEALVLDAITISVGRREQLRDEAIAPVNVIDRNDLDARQARSLGDVLRDIPGVTTSDGPRRSAFEPTIRGLSDGRVVTRVDGARQNLIIDPRGQTFLDPSLLQRVEVLRGPASTLFGSGAIGGVVDFRTLDPQSFLGPDRDFGARINTNYQSNADERLGTLTLAGDNGDFGLLGSITRSRVDDYEDGNGDTVPFSGSDVLSGVIKGTWAPTVDSQFTASYLDFEDDSDSFVTADRPDGDPVTRITRQRTRLAALRTQSLQE